MLELELDELLGELAGDVCVTGGAGGGGAEVEDFWAYTTGRLANSRTASKL